MKNRIYVDRDSMENKTSSQEVAHHLNFHLFENLSEEFLKRDALKNETENLVLSSGAFLRYSKFFHPILKIGVVICKEYNNNPEDQDWQTDLLTKYSIS